MGTHPIFESDFDCLTEKKIVKMGNRNITKDDYKKMLDDNPYLTIPKPEEVKHVRDRYKHANKNEPCWQHKWDLIHCVIESPCVKVDGNRARDCLQRHQLPRFCQALLTNLQDCRVSTISQTSRMHGRRDIGHAISDGHLEDMSHKQRAYKGNMHPKFP